MNFLRLITLLTISPSEGWKDVYKYTIPNNLLLTKLFYPSLAILSLSVFIPFIFGYISVEIENIIISAMIDFIKYFVSFFIISHILLNIYKNVYNSKNEINKLNNFIILTLNILIFFNILRNFMPGFPFFEVFPIYIIFVIYKGLFYINIPKDEALKFICISSILVLLIPSGIKIVLEFLIPNY